MADPTPVQLVKVLEAKCLLLHHTACCATAPGLQISAPHCVMGSAVVARGTQAPSQSGPISDEAAALLAIRTGLSWSQLATEEALKQLKQLKGAVSKD